MKKGISLIVLLVIIIITLILSTTVITTIIGNSPISDANKAVQEHDKAVVQEAVNLFLQRLMVQYKTVVIITPGTLSGLFPTARYSVG
ncbi:MAG: hypothetical protein PHD15_06620 [Clostridia bacterium]|nr:hypothetical protein [Clostridia bacterium]MDD4387404.1 hypothetical protein [Clostridia bacterium]